VAEKTRRTGRKMNLRNNKSKIRCAVAEAIFCRGGVMQVLNRFRLVIRLVLLAAVIAMPGRAAEADHPFRFGFSMALMPDVNENDARAAMKVWAENIVKNGLVRADPNVLTFHDFASMAEALHNRAVDGVAASTSDYFTIQKEVGFNHFVFSVTDGSIYDQYVLLVHQESGLGKVEDLQGRSLNILKHTRMSLAQFWLDTLLMEKGLKPAQDYCGGITEEIKLVQTVLPVFFHKADACVVTLKGFKTMTELNPQVGRQLRVLATSPELVPSGFFFRTGYPPAQQKECLAEFTRVHTNPTGQQILTVFQTERLEEYPATVLDSSLALLARHRQLMAGTNDLKSVAIETNSPQRETVGTQSQ